MAVAPLQLPSSQLMIPQIDWTPLGQLAEIYRAAQNKQKLSDLGKGLADGSIDYRQAAAQSAEMGNSDALFKFLALSEAKQKQADELKASQNFSQTLGGIFGGASAVAATPRPVSASPAEVARPSGPAQTSPNMPMAGPPLPLHTRAPVQSSPTTWGDEEAEAAGLYEPRPGALPQGRPMTLASLGAAYAPGPTATAQGATGGPAPRVAQATQPEEGTRTPTALPAAVPSSSNGFRGLNASHIPALLGAMSDPRLPAAQKEVAGTLLKRALDDSKPNEKIQMLQQLKQESGFQGSLLDLEMQLRKASKTDVTVDQRGENEEAKAAGKAAGERRATMFASAGAAPKTLQNLARAESLLNQVAQGKLEPSRMTVSAWAKALGVNDEVAASLGLDPKGVGSAQALQSLVNESVIGKIGSGGFPANNFSDADREFITGIFPRLGDDPQANRIRIEGARRMANLDLQRAKDYQARKAEPSNKGKNFEDFETDWSEKIAKQDLFGDLRKQAESLVGAPRTDIGGTLANPGPAPVDRVNSGWQDLGGGVRIREKR
ncbi:hypothetical protein GPL17_18775 [Bradyrhizobium yuanmingense]|uniref:hypothetical protein n=1 Tax=Bradyrhizobium yuanmingense TaxID=108015 RepID=UPI0012FB7745|nr:hypothetical protein [Bradyrhizobium yuanmingense]MVT52528.1 hypothetical protein [Bradyrhizobium yuanmingense]